MKKSTIVIIVGLSVAVVVAFAVVMCVLFIGHKIPEQPLNIGGTWKVVVSISNGDTAIVESDYMTFEDGKAKHYRNGEVFAESDFKLDGNNLSLNDINRKYLVTAMTDNYYRLLESSTVYMDIIRYRNADRSPIVEDTSKMTGKWEVIYRNSEKVFAGECLVFDGNSVSDYAGGATVPSATSSYSWNGNVLFVDLWNKKMTLYSLSDNVVFFVESQPDLGFVWELKRVGSAPETPGGKDPEPDPEPAEFSVVGTWKVAVFVNDGVRNVLEKQFMVFGETSVKRYENGAPNIDTEYTLKDNGLALSSPAVTFVFEKVTDNYVRLYQSPTQYMELIRYKNADMSPTDENTDAIVGKWEIVFRNTSAPYAGDYLLFGGGTVGLYHADGTAANIPSSEFGWTGNTLAVSAWHKEMALYSVSDKSIIFVETAGDVGYIWELKKID